MTSDKTINTAIEKLTKILIDASKNCLKLTKTSKKEKCKRTEKRVL